MKPPVAAKAITAEELQRKWLGPHLPQRADQVLDWQVLAEWLNTIRARIPQHDARRNQNASAARWLRRALKELRHVEQRLTDQWIRLEDVKHPTDATAIARLAELDRVSQAATLLEDRILPRLDPDRAPRGGRNFGPSWEGPAREVWTVLEGIHNGLYLRIGHQQESPFVGLVVVLLRRLGFMQLTRDALVQLARRMRTAPRQK